MGGEKLELMGGKHTHTSLSFCLPPTLPGRRKLFGWGFRVRRLREYLRFFVDFMSGGGGGGENWKIYETKKKNQINSVGWQHMSRGVLMAKGGLLSCQGLPPLSLYLHYDYNNNISLSIERGLLLLSVYIEILIFTAICSCIYYMYYIDQYAKVYYYKTTTPYVFQDSLISVSNVYKVRKMTGK